MIFEERKLHFMEALLIPLLFFFIAFPLWQIGERELFWHESDYAVMASELQSVPPVMTTHGQVVTDEYPLFPLFAKGLNSCGFDMAFSLRFISLASLLILAVIVWITCYQAQDITAAAVAAVVMFSVVIVAEKAIEGYPQMLTVLLVFSGWLAWYNQGLRRGRWDMAWILAGFFAALAFYSGGWTALVYFAVPLMFQRRPFSIWKKLNRWGFAVAALIVVGVILFWALPLIFASMDSPLPRREMIYSQFDFRYYFTEFLKFPFDVMIRFWPWTLMLWAPFCPAIVPLDKNPLFTRYLRTIFYIQFVLLWLNPGTTGRDILFLVPLAAVLLGVNYWIVVRKYGHQFLTLFRIAAWVSIVVIPVIMLFLESEKIRTIMINIFLEENPWWIEERVRILQGESYSIILLLAAWLFAFAALILTHRLKIIWMIYLAIFGSGMLIFWAVVYPYRSLDHSRSELADGFAAALRSENLKSCQIIYKDLELAGLYAETYYMKMPIRALRSSADLPESETIYVISARAPGRITRVWTNLYEQQYKGKRLYLWKGVPKVEEEPYDNDDEYDDDEEE